MALNLIDRMLDEWERAKAEGKLPARWRINKAALREIQNDDRLRFATHPKDRHKMQMLGAPITIIDDGLEVATFYLNAESVTKSRNEDFS